MEKTQEELDALDNEAAFDNSDDNAESEEEEVEEQVEQVVEEQVSESAEENDSVADKARVPYSRFETVNERAIRAEERLALLEEQLQANQQAQSDQNFTPDEEWIELYGDSEAATRAYQLQLKREEKMLQAISEKTLEEIEKRQTEKQTEAEQNLNYIEDNLARFQETLGRKLTDDEESAILDVQDEFTPKDEKGNYIAPLLDAEKAFEIANLRNQTAGIKKSVARRKVVSVTGANTESNSESTNSAWDNYKPGDSGLWESKLN